MFRDLTFTESSLSASTADILREYGDHLIFSLHHEKHFDVSKLKSVKKSSFCFKISARKKLANFLDFVKCEWSNYGRNGPCQMDACETVDRDDECPQTRTPKKVRCLNHRLGALFY